MKFAWDEKKRIQNIEKHGIDFIDAIQIFDGVSYTIEDKKAIYDEERFITIGFADVQIILVVHTIDSEIIRIISARKATNYEQKQFFSKFSNRLETVRKAD